MQPVTNSIEDLIFEREHSDILFATFRERPFPVAASLAGYSALIGNLDLEVPLHHTMAAVAPKNLRRKEGGWAIYPSALKPSGTTIDVDMSERTIDLLLRFLKQGQGALAKRARANEFAALQEDEVQEVLAIYAKLFHACED